MASTDVPGRNCARNDSERIQTGRRLVVSWAMLAVVCLVFAGAVAWAFYMGYMAGKGANPQASFHEMTGLMKPETAAPATAPPPAVAAAMPASGTEPKATEQEKAPEPVRPAPDAAKPTPAPPAVARKQPEQKQPEQQPGRLLLHPVLPVDVQQQHRRRNQGGGPENMTQRPQRHGGVPLCRCSAAIIP